MAYRGDDLDLRTPQSWGSAGREGSASDQANWWTRSGSYKGGRGDPIWVDDTVMACCNHAFDLALAHRAPEVRLEHLINALTLNEHAALILEGRGLSVSSLRRESGAAIANDIPTASGTAGGQPKRSEGLEEALRLAAEHAYQRRTPVTVEDILHVLFDMKRDLPGLQLLYRHANAWSGRNGTEPRNELRLDPLPHLSRPQPQRSRFTPAPSPDYFGQQQKREPARQGPRDVPPSASVDTFQDVRLDSLERAVRDIGVDLADDRKTLRSLVTDLQRSTAAQAEDAGRFRGGLNERLAALEDTVLRSRNETAQLPVTVSDRLEMVERTIDTRLGALDRMVERLASEGGRAAVGPSSALLDRLASIERGIEMRLADLGRATAALGERLEAVEYASQRPSEATLSPLVSQRLESITAFGTKVDTLEQTFQLILDRMTGVERKLADGVEKQPKVDLSMVEQRLGEIENSVRKTVEEGLELGPVTELLSGIEARVAGLERTLENRSSETGRTVSFIGERLRSFDEAIGSQKGLLTDRLDQVERSLAAYVETSVAASNAHDNDLSEVHEALIKLNANQQTLAGSLDQWRLDNTGDLSVINNRLKAVEEVDQKQSPQLDGMASQIQAIHAALAKREVRKSRFLHWLFGTDEWYSASYHTKAWRAQQLAPVLPKSSDSAVVSQRSAPPASPQSMAHR